MRSASPIAPTHHSPDVADDAFRLQLAKSNDLRDAAFTVLLPNILENFASARFTKINIDIRWRDPVRIQEPLENETVLQRVDVCNSEHVRDDRTRSRTAPRPDRNTSFLCKMDKVPNNEQITDEPGLFQNAQLVIEPPD